MLIINKCKHNSYLFLMLDTGPLSQHAIYCLILENSHGAKSHKSVSISLKETVLSEHMFTFPDTLPTQSLELQNVIFFKEHIRWSKALLPAAHQSP